MTVSGHPGAWQTRPDPTPSGTAGSNATHQKRPAATPRTRNTGGNAAHQKGRTIRPPPRTVPRKTFAVKV